jgi:hypothetical protein
MSNLMADLKPFLDEYGYWAVFGVTLLENLGVPMPGQTMLIAGALLASAALVISGEGDRLLERIKGLIIKEKIVDSLSAAIGLFAD